jgi:tRNA (mo5U34)-methyltransferase
MSEQVLTTEQIRQRIQELGQWFHNIDLKGVQTAPEHFLGDYPTTKWKRFAKALPHDLRGRTVLDIGCNAGFYSIQMKQRGADRVVAIDTDDKYLEQGRFAAKISGVDIEFRRLSVYRIAELKEQFDLVLFMGVLYHLRHPLLALDLIHEHVVKDLLVVQSMVRGSESEIDVSDDYDFWETENFDDPAFPRLFFIEKRYSRDPTNWWIPNRSCLEAMIRSAGFEIIDSPEAEVHVCRYSATTAVIDPARELEEIFH